MKIATADAPSRSITDYQRAYLASNFEPVQARMRKQMLLALLARLKPRRVLEVGCGTDALFGHWHDFERFVVVEPGELFAAKARRDAEGDARIVVVEDFVENAAPALQGERFDLVLASGLLHEVPDPAALLRALHPLCGAQTLLHELGLSPVLLLLLWAWLAALQSAVALAAAPWTDRVSKARLLPWHWASLALGWVALAAAGGEPALWAAVTLFGVLSGISEGVERALVSERASALSAAPGARRIEGTAFGWYHASGGVAAIGAGLTAGVLWQFGGAALAFGWAAAAALGCAIAFAVVERRRGA